MKSNRDTLFVYCTHGDELIGERAIRLLNKKPNLPPYDTILGNPKARAEKVRYIDSDLNRSAPGKKYSRKYEIRRAFKLVSFFENYRYVIDLHQTLANDRIVVIIPKLTKHSLALALAFNVRDILIWLPSTGSKSFPLVQYKNYGVEIEAGVKTNPARTLRRLVWVLSAFLLDGISHLTRSHGSVGRKTSRKRFYLVYGRIDPKEVVGIKLKDFGKVNTGKEKFVALLFGRHQNLIGYKMKEVDKNWVFSRVKSSG